MVLGRLSLAALALASWVICCAEAVDENRAPTAFAGFDQVVRVGGKVVLDGSASSDPDQDELVYRWTVDRRPPDSLALPEDGDESRPQLHFSPDLPGVFVLRLSVSDGIIDSYPDLVNVYAVVGIPGSTDALPRARAPRNTWVVRDTVTGSFPGVTLDGSAEAIEDGRIPRYTWQSISRPDLSRLGAEDLAGADTPSCRFTPDEGGEYVLSLQVSDGHQVSVADFVTVSALASEPDPTPPVADAGGSGEVLLGDAVRLDGGESSGAGGVEPISLYRWRVALVPGGADVPFEEQQVESFLLVPESEGLYLLRLEVESDGQVSAPDFVGVLALEGVDG